MDTEAETFS